MNTHTETQSDHSTVTVRPRGGPLMAAVEPSGRPSFSTVTVIDVAEINIEVPVGGLDHPEQRLTLVVKTDDGATTRVILQGEFDLLGRLAAIVCGEHMMASVGDEVLS